MNLCRNSVILFLGFYACVTNQCVGALLCYECNSTYPSCSDPFDADQSDRFIMECKHLVHDKPVCSKTVHYLENGNEHIVRGCGWSSASTRQCNENSARACYKIAVDASLQHFTMGVCECADFLCNTSTVVIQSLYSLFSIIIIFLNTKMLI